MEGGPLQETQEWQKWLEDLSKGTISHELEVITLKGMQVVHGQKGLVCCNLVIPDCVSDKDGNWHVGAITTLIDTVGAAAIFSSTGQLKASVDFNISYYSTAKIQEEVEIEAKVIGHKGRLSSVVVEIRRKNNGELIALGKQWMSSINIVPSHLMESPAKTGEKQAEMEDDPPREAQKWIEDLSRGASSHGLETLNLKGLQAIYAQKGLIHCDLVVPDCVSDKDGNWHVGAISTLIDDVGAAAIFSFAGHVKASVDFSVSFYSTAKIQEEVEIEAKVVGHRGRLSSVVVEIRRKSNGELIALGRQWMSAATIIPSHLSKI